mmetsp:Transcript_12739/g.14930  ORF Transcript_12739/g.14930 Transcript_12739/m.14930 type:complete len:85 (+) Transcript_12739:40-294(+)
MQYNDIDEPDTIHRTTKRKHDSFGTRPNNSKINDEYNHPSVVATYFRAMNTKYELELRVAHSGAHHVCDPLCIDIRSFSYSLAK